jgi:putative nucleotidyltransferase with HDIG domain
MPDDDVREPDAPDRGGSDGLTDGETAERRITAEVTAAAGSVQTFSVKQVRRARDLLARLYALRRARRLYPLEHPALVQAARELHEVVSAYHGEGTDVPLTFFEDEVLLGEQVLAEDSVLFDQLIRDMTAIGAGSVTFVRGVTQDEIVRFAEVIGARPDEVAAADGGIATIVERARVPHIIVGTVSVVREDAALRDEDAVKAAKAVYTGALELMRELERLIRSNQAISAGPVKGVVRSLVDNILRNRYAMLELSGLKNFDEYTFYHSVNVAILSLALGSTLTRDYRFLSSLGVGALLHDIGKMNVELDVLNKTGPLTSEEWAKIRNHPVHGAEMTALTNGLDRASIVCVLEHHMRYDLTGYPQRSPQRAQHVASRIVAVADAYDAMTSQRPYSAPRMQDEAMNILVRNAGSALDPTLVRLFIGLLGYFPPRSVVLLSSGETAIVTSPSPGDPAKPRVRVIADADGRLTSPVDIDLSDVEQGGGRSVVRCLDPTGMNVSVADYL